MELLGKIKESYLNNTPKFEGVYQHKGTGKWVSSIKLDGKEVYLGLFAYKLEALRAYCSAADKSH